MLFYAQIVFQAKHLFSIFFVFLYIYTFGMVGYQINIEHSGLISKYFRELTLLTSFQTRIVIENLKRASDNMAMGVTVQRETKTANDADALLRVLCHRMDTEASSYLKKQYKLPKASA